MASMGIPKGWWCGASWATQDDYDHIMRIYGKHSLSKYNFMIENNLRRAYVTVEPRARCGIWTLANIKVRYDLTPGQVAGMAMRMRRAVEIYEDQ